MSHRAGHRRCEGRPRMERPIHHRYRCGTSTLNCLSRKAWRALIERAWRKHVRQSIHMGFEWRWELRQRRIPW